MIHRYSYRQNIYMGGCKGAMIGNLKNGEYVKYEDIKHLLPDPKNTIHNSEYATALEVLREYVNNNGVQGKIIDVVKWMKERLNSQS